MEINGRPYGSLELAVKSGLDFPWHFYEMETVGKKTATGCANAAQPHPILHDEVIRMPLALLRGHAHEFFEWLASLRQSFAQNEFIEDSLFTDPGFVIGLYTADIKRIVLRIWRGMTLFFIRIQPPPALPRRRDETIAFVCAGNICRSPFAEMYARKLRPAIEVTSFGLVPEPGRRSPLQAVRSASKFGVDLEAHRSRPITEHTNTLFLAADRRVYRALRSRGIPADRVRFFAPFEIEDPFGGSAQQFERSFGKIAASLDRLLRVEELASELRGPVVRGT